MRRINLPIFLALLIPLILVLVYRQCLQGRAFHREMATLLNSTPENSNKVNPSVQNITDKTKRNQGDQIPNNRRKPTNTIKSNLKTVSRDNIEDNIRLLGGIKKHRLPKAIVIGFSKCGTRAFLEFLALHPRIVSGGPEINFFNSHYEEGLDWYQNRMPVSYASQIVMEKSPEYVHDPETPKRIHKMNDTIKLIVLLCDPVRRAVSEYLQAMSKQEPQDIYPFGHFAINPKTREVNDKYWTIKRGRYSVYMNPWFQYFSLQQIHIVDGDVFRESPIVEIVKTEAFLGIERYFNKDTLILDEEKGFYCINEGNGKPRCLGESKGRPHPKINQQVIKAVQKFFKPYNLELYKMVKRNFTW